MNKFFVSRRRSLLYLGLGIVSTTTSKALGMSRRLDNYEPQRKEPEILASSSIGSNIPELRGITTWLNSPPLTLASLKGNVILLQFWTFACINCQRTLPHIVEWHKKYAAKGLKVIGVHTPEFAYEKDTDNIKRAIQRHQITYPVPVDNQYKTWQAYNNEYWPHLFLADRQGILRYDHIGEEAYDTTEQNIVKLLA